MALSTIKTASITDDAVTAPKVSDGVFNAHRNLIINGAMQFAQRSTSTASVTSGAYHACDRWNILALALEHIQFHSLQLPQMVLLTA